MSLPRLREPEQPPPRGYRTWRPRMGRGGRFMAWLILGVIALGCLVMILTIIEQMGR